MKEGADDRLGNLGGVDTRATSKLTNMAKAKLHEVAPDTKYRPLYRLCSGEHLDHELSSPLQSWMRPGGATLLRTLSKGGGKCGPPMS